MCINNLDNRKKALSDKPIKEEKSITSTKSYLEKIDILRIIFNK